MNELYIYLLDGINYLCAAILLITSIVSAFLPLSTCRTFHRVKRKLDSILCVDVTIWYIIGASLSEPHMVSSTRALSVCLSRIYVSVKLELFRKLNATHARSVQHHVQFGQFLIK